MEQSRIRIVDIAQTLGLSTDTVSNVLHGKTEKLSGETVKRVQQELERTGYIPNMARNNSRIIGFDGTLASRESTRRLPCQTL